MTRQILGICAYMHFEGCPPRSNSDPKRLITFEMKKYQNTNNGVWMLGLYMIFFFSMIFL